MPLRFPILGEKFVCFAKILTYFATHAPAQPFATKERYGCGVPLAGIPYLYTPTSVSCLSSEPFWQSPSVPKKVFRHAGLSHLRQLVSLIEVYPICLSCEPSCWCCRRWARFSPPALPRCRLLLPLRPTRRDRRGRADAGACLPASLPQRHGDCAVPVLGGAQTHCSPVNLENPLVFRHLPALCPHRAHLHLPRAFPKGRMEAHSAHLHGQDRRPSGALSDCGLTNLLR